MNVELAANFSSVREPAPSFAALSAESRLKHFNLWMDSENYKSPMLTDREFAEGYMNYRDDLYPVLWEENTEIYHDDASGFSYQGKKIFLKGFSYLGIEFHEGIHPEETIVFAEMLQYDHQVHEGFYFQILTPTAVQRKEHASVPRGSEVLPEIRLFTSEELVTK